MTLKEIVGVCLAGASVSNGVYVEVYGVILKTKVEHAEFKLCLKPIFISFALLRIYVAFTQYSQVASACSQMSTVLFASLSRSTLAQMFSDLTIFPTHLYEVLSNLLDTTSIIAYLCLTIIIALIVLLFHSYYH